MIWMGFSKDLPLQIMHELYKIMGDTGELYFDIWR